MKNICKYLPLLLVLLSMGGASGFGNTMPQVREQHSSTSEDLRAANAMPWAYRENLQEIFDLSENLFFPGASVIPEAFSNVERLRAATSGLIFTRDLRQKIFQQIFPKHFFL